MRIIARKTLVEFWEVHGRAEQALKSWFHEVKNAKWAMPSDVISAFNKADILPGNRVVFNIKGNRYRLVVKINYNAGIVYIRFIGTHSEYDRVDAEKV